MLFKLIFLVERYYELIGIFKWVTLLHADILDFENIDFIKTQISDATLAVESTFLILIIKQLERFSPVFATDFFLFRIDEKYSNPFLLMFVK